VTLQKFPAIGAAICGLSVALGAYASHAASAQDQHRFALAALFAFAHGLALVVMASRSSMLAGVGKLFFLVGIVLFCGSLTAAGFFGTTTKAVPFGGSLLILGWLVAATDYWREP
jgi:uncharacterized membrane protein YgdD (TMEM256/DUF423 family)